MSVLEDTGQLQAIRTEPIPPRPLDLTLLGVASIVFLTLGLWGMLMLAPDDYPVERGRVVLTLAACATCTAPILAAIYGVSRANKRRHADIKKWLERTAVHSRCDCDSADLGRLAATVNGLAAKVDQLDAKIGTYWNGYTAGVADVTGDAKVIPLVNGSKPG